jgi:hypothetical protein
MNSTQLITVGVVIMFKTPWPKSARELYRPSDRRLSAKLVPTFADRESHVVSVTVPYGRVLSFLDLRRYFFFQVDNVYSVQIKYLRKKFFRSRSSWKTACPNNVAFSKMYSFSLTYHRK